MVMVKQFLRSAFTASLSLYSGDFQTANNNTRGMAGLYKVAIIPGNGGGDVTQSNWYKWVAQTLLNEVPEVGEVELRNMPDPVLAREKIWLPFMEEEIQCNEKTIIIGHSSGAEAAMRYAETHYVAGLVLVSACVTDLGIESERVSGYYSRPWHWEQIQQHAGFIMQFGSRDDPYIPFIEQVTVAQGLTSDFYTYLDRGHFQRSEFPELVDYLKEKLRSGKEASDILEGSSGGDSNSDGNSGNINEAAAPIPVPSNLEKGQV